MDYQDLINDNLYEDLKLNELFQGTDTNQIEKNTNTDTNIEIVYETDGTDDSYCTGKEDADDSGTEHRYPKRARKAPTRLTL